MESGSIVKWCLKEGDKFEAGTAICEVETDKATVTNEATEDGYIAKILVGTGEIKVGQPLMVTVEDQSSVAAFANFTAGASTPAVKAAPASKPAAPTPSPVATSSAPVTSSSSSSSSTVTPNAGDRVIASPYARTLARESGVPIHLIQGTGPHGRIIGEDVLNAKKSGVQAPAVATSTTTAIAAPAPAVGKVSLPPTGVPGVYQDFEQSEQALAIALRQTQAKQFIPHYYLSIEINLEKLMKVRASLNQIDDKGTKLSVIDFFVKASALAMKTVPDCNGSWMDTFIRRYSQVDVNVVTEGHDGLITPVVKDAGSIGLKSIAGELTGIEDSLAKGESIDSSKISVGTFAIHDLGTRNILHGFFAFVIITSCVFN